MFQDFQIDRRHSDTSVVSGIAGVSFLVDGDQDTLLKDCRDRSYNIVQELGEKLYDFNTCKLQMLACNAHYERNFVVHLLQC